MIFKAILGFYNESTNSNVNSRLRKTRFSKDTVLMINQSVFKEEMTVNMGFIFA